MKIIEFVLTLISINYSVKCSLNSKPNIIIFLSDDLGWNDIQFHGSRHLRTPNIDSLAADGIVMNRYYTQPLCSPSRGALLTGIHPIHSGTQNFVLLGASPWGLPLRHKLLPQYLKDLGYSTHAIGKWHLGFFRKEYIPTSRGFDSHIGYWNAYEDYYNHSMTERGYEGFDFRHDLDVNRKADGIYSTDYFTESAVNLITEHKNTKPLFLYMSYQSVHSANNPYELQAPKHLIQKFSYIKDDNRRAFAATLYSMDLSIGTIVKQLQNKNLLNDSILLFLSDNGGAISGFMENSASNYPLRGTKGSLWEGGVRVPAVIWSPLLQNSGYICDNYIQVIDLIPTLLEVIDDNYAKNNRNKFDGKSFWKELNEKKCRKDNELLLNVDNIWNMSSIIVNDWKLIQGSVPKQLSPKSDEWSQSYDNESDSSHSSTNTERIESFVYKVLQKLNRKPNFDFLKEGVIECGIHKNIEKCDSTQDFCLFDIRSDPCEYNNLAKSYPKIVEKLWLKILDYNKTAVSPLNLPIDPMANPIHHNNTWDIWVKD